VFCPACTIAATFWYQFIDNEWFALQLLCLIL
jgi:hypothetical protein